MIDTKVFAEWLDYGNQLALSFIRRGNDRGESIVLLPNAPDTLEGEGNEIAWMWRKPDPGEYYPPTIRLSKDRARELMDALWAVGCRPTDHKSPGQLHATEKHLEDMRKIAFKFLGEK